MSYVEQGAIGLGVGIPLLFLPPASLVLILLSVIMLSYGLVEVVPGSRPFRCSKWSHDWRRQLPLLPAGTTCRNCLVRKDGALLAWRSPPGAIPHLLDPFSGLLLAHNAPAYAAKKGAREFILVDDPKMPHLPYVPGRPPQFPPAPPIKVAAVAMPPRGP